MPAESPIRSTGAASRGAWGERLAETVLSACGYACRDRRCRIGGAEIDLVMSYGPDLVFVEVKTRRGDGLAEPECFLPPAQRRRIRRAALAWLAAHPGQAAPRLRFDVVAIVDRGAGGGLDLRHLPDAF